LQIKEKSKKIQIGHKKNICFKTEVFEQPGLFGTPFENEDTFIPQEEIKKHTRFLPKKEIKNKKTIFTASKDLKETKRKEIISKKMLRLKFEKLK
jgi:hypothetical protein